MDKIKIMLDRDSVCMGDDCIPHETPFEINGEMHIRDFIHCFLTYKIELPPECIYPEPFSNVRTQEFFPQISGGKATWVLRMKKGHNDLCDIAVIAQQWDEPKLLIENMTVRAIVDKFTSNEMHLKYRCQIDPMQVYSQLTVK